MRRVFQWLLLGLIWSLMAVFSWAYVAIHVHEQNASRAAQINSQSLAFFWDLSSRAQVVSSFQDEWQMVADGLLSAGPEPAISMHFAGQYLDPRWQGLLTITTRGTLPEGSRFRLEFSDQTTPRYFDSGELPASKLNQAMDLAQLRWSQKMGDDGHWSTQSMNWSDLPTLDALVVRFYGPAGSTWSLGSIELAQWPDTRGLTIQVQLCQNQPSWFNSACWLTNQMHHHDQQTQRAGLSQQLVVPTSPLAPLLWLLFAAGLLWVVVGAWSQASHPVKQRLRLFAVVGLVPLGIGLMHIKWPFDLGQILYWLVPLGAVALMWGFRTHFKRPSQFGWPVLIGTLLVALVMWLYSGRHGGFITGLPMYFLWAWVQQLLLGPVMTDHLRTELTVSDGTLAVLVGVLFSVVHAPNHMLMLATLAGGVVWSYSWLRYRNLYLNSFSHALLALMFYQFMSDPWLGSARIGHFFL
ncbi:CPBP family intramembrane glutamic endopeptidase [Marinicella meishanensis]|uniref:CPBP family intramembrane glutamic endopeptidase n=1 Tax=Marinicella meishanensis TaxID=2873263 RepID=UPI001CC06690|nr:CPBP family intramembrane glutamic endopeptidase [Marinicella sp. NBU2979]